MGLGVTSELFWRASDGFLGGTVRRGREGGGLACGICPSVFDVLCVMGSMKRSFTIMDASAAPSETHIWNSSRGKLEDVKWAEPKSEIWSFSSRKASPNAEFLEIGGDLESPKLHRMWNSLQGELQE